MECSYYVTSFKVSYMSSARRKVNINTSGHGSILRNNAKISLFADAVTGWLCSAGLRSSDLQVESVETPENFEVNSAQVLGGVRE